MDTETFLKDKGTIKINKEGNWFFNDLPIVNNTIYGFLNQIVEADGAGVFDDFGLVGRGVPERPQPEEQHPQQQTEAGPGEGGGG